MIQNADLDLSHLNNELTIIGRDTIKKELPKTSTHTDIENVKKEPQ